TRGGSPGRAPTSPPRAWAAASPPRRAGRAARAAPPIPRRGRRRARTWKPASASLPNGGPLLPEGTRPLLCVGRAVDRRPDLVGLRRGRRQHLQRRVGHLFEVPARAERPVARAGE